MHGPSDRAQVRALRRLDPPNVGVAGPKVYGDGSSNKMHGGITIDVVHRTHLRIFREYYPPQLDNWYTDLWMVYAYVHVGDSVDGKGVRRVVKLSRKDNFTVAHRFERRRYRASTSQLKYLAALTECSRLAVWSYINATRAGAKPGRPLSCRAYATLPAAAAAAPPKLDAPDKPDDPDRAYSPDKPGRRAVQLAPVSAVCSPRRQMIGGLEMSPKNMESSAAKIAGFCRETGPRPAVLLS